MNNASSNLDFINKVENLISPIRSLLIKTEVTDNWI